MAWHTRFPADTVDAIHVCKYVRAHAPQPRNLYTQHLAWTVLYMLVSITS